MQSLPLVLAILVGGAVASGFTVLFLRARLRERAGPDPSAAPSTVAQEVQAIGLQIGQALSEQRLQGETQRQLLAQKLDGVRQSVESQRSHVDGLRNELRHEVRRRDAELEEIRSQIGSIRSAVALPPAAAQLPPALPDVDARPEEAPASEDAAGPWSDGPAAEAHPEDHAEPVAEASPAEPRPPTQEAGPGPHAFDLIAHDLDSFLDSFADVPSGDSVSAGLAPSLAGAEVPAAEADAEDRATASASARPSDDLPFDENPFEDATFEDVPPDAPAAHDPFAEDILAGDMLAGDDAPAFKTFSPEELVSGGPSTEGDLAEAAHVEAADAPAPEVPTSDLLAVPAGETSGPLAEPVAAPQTVFEDVSFDVVSFENLPLGDDLVASPAFEGVAFGDAGQTPAPDPTSAQPPLSEAAASSAWIARSAQPAPRDLDGASPADGPFSAPPLLEVPGTDGPTSVGLDGEAAPAHPPPGPSDDADDLTVIRAIDEHVQRRLYAEGVTSLEEIARWDRAYARQISARVRVPEETIMNQWVFEAQAALFNQFAAQTGA